MNVGEQSPDITGEYEPNAQYGKPVPHITSTPTKTAFLRCSVSQG